jgi:hypothetical protein
MRLKEEGCRQETILEEIGQEEEKKKRGRKKGRKKTEAGGNKVEETADGTGGFTS